MKTILVVEDDPVNQMILSDFLTANSYRTVTASSGPEGIAAFDRERPDLCIVDVQLPRASGLELVQELKRRVAATPVLLMSAELAHVGAFADGYLAKPFDLHVLLARVRQLIGAT